MVVDGGIVDGGIVDGGIVDGGMVDGGMVDGGIVDGGIVVTPSSICNRLRVFCREYFHAGGHFNVRNARLCRRNSTESSGRNDNTSTSKCKGRLFMSDGIVDGIVDDVGICHSEPHSHDWARSVQWGGVMNEI